ncbi:hypothetical protein BDN72DRAFT_334336 [Pluteus cervinus]|uniref:Uncharacterized protein n=1 Tax=Pluteus cervinus TaxID=181527 RepID=A0ACD3B2T4_9AGAR|nr:hypothetical protein BDN72DRAFT_334336 [Pluteus cervinus]
MKRVLFTLILLAIPLSAIGENFEVCLKEFQDGKFGHLEAGRDNHGNPVSNFSDATALTYVSCLEFCGSGQEPPSWNTLSQQFSAWLLPWLALLSQLPFGSTDILDNLASIVLTVGSPTLAAFSLAITVMNGRWIVQRFQPIRSPTARTVVRVLSRLQQSPVEVTSGRALTSLVKLEHNHAWWDGMLRDLSYTHTWSIAAGTSIAWVVIAYVFTVADSFSGDMAGQVHANGQSIGSQWLFLLALVLGWLQISPKCDSPRVDHAFDEARSRVYVERPLGGGLPDKLDGQSPDHPIELGRDILWESSLRRDEFRHPPVYNYSRVIAWTADVLKIAQAFEVVQAQQSVSPPLAGYTAPIDRPTVGLWDSGILWRMALASLFALFLQWGTTGAALIVTIMTPTIGLGCRSLSFIIFGSISTAIWFFMLISALLTHAATGMYKRDHQLSNAQRSYRSIIKWIAILLRRTCKLAAIINAIGVVVACFFQFTNVFDNCWCNSSVLGLGVQNAYNVISFTQEDIAALTRAWVGGVVLGIGSATVFMSFIAIQLNS